MRGRWRADWIGRRNARGGAIDGTTKQLTLTATDLRVPASGAECAVAEGGGPRCPLGSIEPQEHRTTPRYSPRSFVRAQECWVNSARPVEVPSVTRGVAARGQQTRLERWGARVLLLRSGLGAIRGANISHGTQIVGV